MFLGDSSSLSLLSQTNGHLYPDSPSPSPPYPHKPKHLLRNEAFKSSADSRHPAHIPPPLVHREMSEFPESHKKPQGPHNALAPSQKRDALQNGRNRPSERFTSEAFVQHFHQAVLQSTHNALQNKGQPLSRRHLKMTMSRLLAVRLCINTLLKKGCKRWRYIFFYLNLSL